MGNLEMPGTASKAPEQSAAPATTPPVSAPDATSTPDTNYAKDIFDMSDEEFEKAEEALAQQDEGGQPPAGDTKTTDASPEPKTEDGKKEEGAQAPDMETMKAELDKLRQENQIAREFQENPVAAAKKYPDIAKQIVDAQRQAHADSMRGQRPEWAYVPVDRLTVPNNPQEWGQLANWPVAELAKKVDSGELDPGVYQKVVTRLANMQGEARGRWETGQNAERQNMQARQQVAWDELAAELKAENPNITPEQLQAEGRKIMEFVTGRVPHPRDFYRLMKFDELISAAEKRGEERGRQAAVKDLEAAGRAPSSVQPSREGDGGGPSLLEQFKAMSEIERARAMENWSDTQIAKLEAEARERGVNLDAL